MTHAPANRTPTSVETGSDIAAEPVTPPDARAARVPPWPVLAAASVVVGLHAVPFLRTRLGAPSPGMAWIGVPYIPKDWLQYLAFVRQEPLDGQWFLANPFTTDAQDGRFILLLLQVLNWIRRLTGIDPSWLLELSRAVLVVGFAVALWHFLGGVFRSDRTRAWAVGLALLGGGLDFAGTWLAGVLPPELARTTLQDLWPMYGWTTFQTLYNPLWAAGLLLLLVALRPILQPGGPRSARELVVTGAALLALWFTHPYSAMAAAAIVATSLAGEWLAAGSLEPRRVGRIALAALPPLAIAAVVALWQRGDVVFRSSSGGVFGAQAAPIFWYPLTLGAVGAFAIRGWSLWSNTHHPWRFALGGWFVGIALLHSSPIVNGYHFVSFLFLPVAIVAAGPVERAFDALRGRFALSAVLAVTLLASTVATTWRAYGEAGGFQLRREAREVVDALSRMPPGNVLCDAEIGNVIPAFGSHRVYVGHWFMTPEFRSRAELVARALQPGGLPYLRRLVESDRIDYVVVWAGAAPVVADALADRSPRIEMHGALSLISLGAR